MKLNRIALLLAAFTLAFGIVWAQDLANLPREKTAIFDKDGGIVSQPLNHNWMVPGSASRSVGTHQAIYEPLFILNYETGEIMPYLGTEMTANDTLDVWTLKIREGVEWADGEAFNADDVVFTVNLLLGDETQSLNEAANHQQWVESVEKIDDLTVQFNLTAPNPRFQLDFYSVRIWGGTVMLPEHIWADKDPFTFENYDPEQGWPMGTGPYTMVSASESEFIYQRNDNWWGADGGIPEVPGVDGLPEPEWLVWVVSATEENRSLLASEAELDSVMDITLGAFEAINTRNPNVLSWVDGPPFAWLDPCARQLSFNMEDPVWSNQALRHAVDMIIDRDQIIEVAYENTTIASRTLYVEYGGLFPVIDAIVDAGMNSYAAPDLAGAAALIEGEGYALNGDGFYEKDGEVLSLTIETHEGFIEKRRIAAVVVEQLRAAGIDGIHSNIAGATWDDNFRFGNFQSRLDWSSCGSINEPYASLNEYSNQFYRPIGEAASKNEYRWSGEDNDRYSELVEQIGSLPLGDPAITDLAVEAYTILHDARPAIAITQAKKLVPFDYTYWTGWPSAENNYNHPATWWQSTHQIIHNLEAAQ